MKVAVDLTWVRHEIVGGTESYVINLLDGLGTVNDDIDFLLVVTEDNKYVFERFLEYKHFSLMIARVKSQSRTRRVLWQNLRMNSLLKRHEVNLCIEPVYLMPFTSKKGIKYITTIHDLQAAHYPEYFSKLRVLWMKLGWLNTTKSSDIVIATSEYAKRDIMSRYNIQQDKIVINYDPVTIDKNDTAPIDFLNSLGARSKEYYYMVSSLLPHKNITTIISALSELKKRNSPAAMDLFVSGVGGKSKDELLNMARNEGIEDLVHLTPFVKNSERNLLYRECRAFLAPSLFEGFGMPPIEAMLMGVPVITTKESCSYEITGGLATYVDEAKNVEKWCDALESELGIPAKESVASLIDEYTKESVARRFISLARDLCEGDI